MKLSLKKYLTYSLKWLLPFTFLEIFIGVLRFTGVVEATLFVLVNIINLVCLLIPGVYYLAMFFVFKRKCGSFTPSEGVITNWEAGFFRYSGKVIIKTKEGEYSTSAYFSRYEAKETVGKTVSYAVIDETLFIYEVKE